MMDIVKVYAMMGKSGIVHCGSIADKSRIAEVMRDWPEELRALVYITCSEEVEMKEPKQPAMAWFEESSIMTQQQWNVLTEIMERRRK